MAAADSSWALSSSELAESAGVPSNETSSEAVFPSEASSLSTGAASSEGREGSVWTGSESDEEHRRRGRKRITITRRDSCVAECNKQKETDTGGDSDQYL